MDIKTIINSAGLILTLIGVYLVYKGSPIHYDKISGGSAQTDWEKVKRETDRKNRLVTIGVYLVIIGTVLQLISNFIPATKTQPN
jgi:uncharacterized membrane protein